MIGFLQSQTSSMYSDASPGVKAMVKVILQIYRVIPAADEEERIRLRLIGRNVERYQETLQGWTDIVQAADELGL